jgi:medium-chain acyl-[acyl-carrier-protein] hydrolase
LFSLCRWQFLLFPSWIDYLPKTIEICPVELPGRGSQIQLTPFNRIEPLVKAITLEILPYLDRPFVFFGHSMGGLISFELARLIRRQYNLEPVHLFISGRRAPQINNLKTVINNLPKADLIRELRQLNGTPEEVLNNDELMEILLPILRADFSVLENYMIIRYNLGIKYGHMLGLGRKINENSYQ